MIIRMETPSDYNAITKITKAAFKTLPVSNHTEHYIIRALRKARALTISLVAEVDNKVVGHIAFSPVTISDGTKDWYVLGPVSVVPELQKRGIGKALIYEGLSILNAIRSKGCALVGDPNYYSRFGFKNYPQLTHKGIPQEVFLVLPFTQRIPRGRVTFHQAYSAQC